MELHFGTSPGIQKAINQMQWMSCFQTQKVECLYLFHFDSFALTFTLLLTLMY